MSDETKLTLDVAHAAAQILEGLGVSAKVATLRPRIEGILSGISAESEFAFLLTWLGRIQLVHGLDQVQAPVSSKLHYRVPDLYVIFDRDGTPLPALVEVKSTKSLVLNWRPDYYEPLHRYAELLEVPLLVAWQLKPLGGLWTLFDVSHFSRPNKNYVIRWELALRESLMGELAGDVVIRFRPGAGFRIRLKKERLVRRRKTDDGHEEMWHGRIETAYPLDGDGHKLEDTFPGLTQLLFIAPLQDVTTTTDTHIEQSLVVTEENAMIWGHRSVVNLIHLKDQPATLPWRRMSSGGRMPFPFPDLVKAAEEGMKRRIVHLLMHIQPNTRPSFIAKD